MSIVEEIRVGTIETTEIDESQIDDDKSIHLWQVPTHALCGSTKINHKSDCPFMTKEWRNFGRSNENECPGCGVPICTFCLFLDEENRKNA